MSLIVYGYIFLVTFALIWAALERVGKKPDEDKIAKKEQRNEEIKDFHLRIPAYLRDTKRLVKLAVTGEVNGRFPSMFEIQNIDKVHNIH